MADSQNTRVTVNLIPKAAKAMKDESHDSAMNQTDVVNRALIVYRYLQQAMRENKEILLGSEGKTEILRIV
jgi:hypothetical protein